MLGEWVDEWMNADQQYTHLSRQPVPDINMENAGSLGLTWIHTVGDSGITWNCAFVERRTESGNVGRWLVETEVLAWLCEFLQRHWTTHCALSLLGLHQEKDSAAQSHALPACGVGGWDAGGEPDGGAPGLWEPSLQDGSLHRCIRELVVRLVMFLVSSLQVGT